MLARADGVQSDIKRLETALKQPPSPSIRYTYAYTMFEWDAFNEAEVAAHDLTLVEVEDVFADPRRRRESGYEVDGEIRWRLTGQARDGRILGVIYTWRGDLIRVITAYSQYGRRRRDYLQGGPR